jgi:hypothetical protein
VFVAGEQANCVGFAGFPPQYMPDKPEPRLRLPYSEEHKLGYAQRTGTSQNNSQKRVVSSSTKFCLSGMEVSTLAR